MVLLKVLDALQKPHINIFSYYLDSSGGCKYHLVSLSYLNGADTTAVFRHVDVYVSFIGIPSVLYPHLLEDAVDAAGHVMQFRKE